MIRFAALFRAQGLRINEYGRKTLELVVGEVAPPLHTLLTFVQHMLISVFAALPLLWLLARVEGRGRRVAVGTLYGAVFYAAFNAWALPLYFGDPTPWALGFDTVYPSLAIHLVYGAVIGLVARAPQPAPGRDR
jgi:uncharacterized membrane protein YagU involved in acid resistance